LHYLSICVLLLSEGWHRETDHQPGKGEHIFIFSYGGQDFLLPDDLPQDFLRGCRTQYCHLSARLIRIEDIAAAQQESGLASSESSWVAGQTFVIDGGLTAGQPWSQQLRRWDQLKERFDKAAGQKSVTS
jgi:NAD(P)-dependent dehydrogenase (short-subunit alcohol dehydrogenase family)